MNEQDRQALEEAVRRCGGIAGLVVQKNGVRAYEGYWDGFSAKDAVHVFSVTKSVISALIGAALDQGFLQSVRQSVLDFFPDYTPKRGEKTLQTVTLRDLLTMTAPYKYRSAPYTKHFSSSDWVRSSLDLLGGRGRVGDFRYAPVVGPDILSGVLRAATGQSVLDFAEDRLFTPLGFSKKHSVTFPDKDGQMAWYRREKHGGEWAADAQGVHAAGWGLTLTAREMAAIGQLYLDGGAAGGRQLLSSGWVAESTAAHSRWAEAGLSYGYLWWVLDKDRFAAVGDGGNVVYVNRAKGLTVAAASVFRPRVTDRVAFIQQQIEPLF